MLNKFSFLTTYFIESQIKVQCFGIVLRICKDLIIELMSNIKYVKVYRKLHFLEFIFKELSGTSRCVEDCLFVVDINVARRGARSAYNHYSSRKYATTRNPNVGAIRVQIQQHADTPIQCYGDTRYCTPNRRYTDTLTHSSIH